MTGTEIKEQIKASGVKCRQVADKLNIADSTFCRHLRYSFDEAETKRILKAIDELKKA